LTIWFQDDLDISPKWEAKVADAGPAIMLNKFVDYTVELNCNYIRLAHHPHHQAVLDLCDEKGLLVSDEIYVYRDI